MSKIIRIEMRKREAVSEVMRGASKTFSRDMKDVKSLDGGEYAGFPGVYVTPRQGPRVFFPLTSLSFVVLDEEAEPKALEPVNDNATPALAALTVAELRKLASDKGVAYEGLRKAELVDALGAKG